MGAQVDVRLHDRADDVLCGAAVWLLFSLAVLNEFVTTNPGVPLARPGTGDVLGAILIGLVVAAAGVFIDSRGAPLRVPPTRSQVQLALFAALAGAALGLVIVGQVAVLAEFDSGVRQRYEMFISEPPLHPLYRAFSAAVLEEVLFRYIGMTAIALFVTRQFARPQRAYPVALIVSATVFGLSHLPALSFAGLVVVLFNTLGGFVFGWIFWHWGLLHAMCAHFVAGVLIQSLGPRLFAC